MRSGQGRNGWRIRAAGWIAAAGLLAAASGCGPNGYVLHAIFGELQLLSAAVPIERALERDTSLTDDQRTKLEFILRARDYAQNVVGLNVGRSYRDFANLRGESLSWNLSASRKDRFEPYYWHLPIVGALPYLGFFDFDRAVAERDRLVKAGWDTFMYEVDAYSTLGLLPDPVTSPLLRRSIPSLADTVMHELLHNTVWKTGDTTFNESMATFVGREAGLEFLRAEFGEESEFVQKAMDSYHDSDLIDGWLQSMNDELRALYDSGLSSEEKIVARVAIFEAHRQRYVDEVLPQMIHPELYQAYKEIPLNNAFLLVNTRYNSDLDVFARIHNLTGKHWPSTLDHFRSAAAAPDPIAHLKGILAATQPAP